MPAFVILLAFTAFACDSAAPRLAPSTAASAPASTRPVAASTRPFAPLGPSAHLINAHVVTAKLISGAQPEGEDSFRALKEMGVKTIISVDGTQPDVETARKFGLRYVHLPITYSTVTPAEGRAIAKAIEELPGLIYLHCHHGKHRSAAATAVACVYNGTLPPERAEEVLRTFGTGANYIGLWKAARDARPLAPEELRDVHVRYVERAQIPKFAEAMVEIDNTLDRLKAIERSGWRTPADHPDLDPAHEALLLQEHFREIARTPEAAARPADFRDRLVKVESAADALRRTLATAPIDPSAAAGQFKALGANCAACHKAYRD
jgi:protein tyrosine phosphatase (PTP) superfamily phosphohydrolase (DUF442 family)